jgi:carbamoyl-phosphate synthase large subunit
VKRTAVLVTGAGTLLGQGVLRCLRASGLPLRIVTADPDPRASGHFLGDTGVLVPLAADPGYVARVEEVLRAEKTDVVLVGTDVELPVFARERPRLERELGVRVVVSPPDVVEIADDKLRTAQFLEAHGFSWPRSAVASDAAAVARLVDEVGLPLFAKPRRGARSIGARVLRDRAELEAACAAEPQLVVQELLPDADGEYTAGVMRVGGRAGGAVVLRRDLREGNTFRAYNEPANDRFAPFVADLAERLGADGPCNFQFRIKDGRPTVFEINARFSGTTPIRALFGWNEVEHLLRWLVDGTPLPAPVLRPGVALRTTGDLFVDAGDLARFAAERRLDAPRGEPFPFLNPRRGQT